MVSWAVAAPRAVNTPTVSFGCTALVGTNKRGTLKCSSDGYYEVVLGALNHYNSAGAYYPLAPAETLFRESSGLMRRIASGNLRGECGHPRRQHNDSDRDFALRLNDIYEPNISHHIRRVWLLPGHKDEQGRSIVLVMGEVKPSGPRGPALKEALDNNSEDVCFSIRSFTNDYPVGGTIHKYLRQIVTWDWVNEPGISAAHKWRTPTLESYQDTGVLTREEVLHMVEAASSGIGMESSRGGLEELVTALGWNRPLKASRPPSDRW